jgi:hypothetical protein
MRTRYIVLDHDGNISWDSEKDRAESFLKFRGQGGAEARAKELADLSPGCSIQIYELTAEAHTPTKPVEVHRKHPTEHYE